MMMDDDMLTGLGILKSTIELLNLSSKPFVRSKVAESASALMVVESVLADLQDVLKKNEALIALYNENEDNDNDSSVADLIPRRSPSLLRKSPSLKYGVDDASISSYSNKPPAPETQGVPISSTSRALTVSGSSHSILSNSRGSTPRGSSHKNRRIAFTDDSKEPGGRPPARASNGTSTSGGPLKRPSSFFKQISQTGAEVEQQIMDINPTKHMTAEEHEKIKIHRLKQEEEDSRTMDIALKAQEAFMILDKDHSGSLDVSELKKAFKCVPQPQLDEMIEQMMKETGHDGAIDVAEFVAMFTKPQFAGGSFNDIHIAFNDITDDLIKEHNRRNLDMVIGDSKYLFDPRGFFSVQWDLLIALLLITTIFTMPLSMAFQYFEETLFPLDFAADILFMLDVMKHFHTGYIDEFDFSIMDSKRVTHHYLSTWFVPDVLSSIPVEVINVIFTSGVPGFLKASRILKLLRLSRLAKVFRLMKVTKLGKLVITCKEAFEDYFRVQIPEAFLILGRLWMSLLVLAHWVGCINFMVVRLYDFPEESWVVFADIQDVAINIQYSWCFFKALAQLIGVGFDIPPIVNTSCLERTEWCTVEHWITLTCLYIGSVYVALLISSISYVIVNMNKGSSNLSMQLWTLNEYLASKKVPYSIRDRVRNFYRIRFAEGKMYEEEEILRNLPPNLRDDILSHNQKHVYEQVPLLASPNTPQALRSRLAPMLEKRIMFQHEQIFDEGAIGTEMFFIVSGIVEIVSEHRTSIIKAISDGCYFGDVAVLLGGRRTATTRARTNLVLSVVSKSEMLELVAEFPLIKKYMVYIAEKRKLRLAALDPDMNIPPLTDEQKKDEEDAQTKYFIKVESVKNQDDLYSNIHDPHKSRSQSMKSPRNRGRSFSDNGLFEDNDGDVIDQRSDSGSSSVGNGLVMNVDEIDKFLLMDDQPTRAKQVEMTRPVPRVGSVDTLLPHKKKLSITKKPKVTIGGDSSFFPPSQTVEGGGGGAGDTPRGPSHRSGSGDPRRSLSPLARPKKKPLNVNSAHETKYEPLNSEIGERSDGLGHLTKPPQRANSSESSTSDVTISPSPSMHEGYTRHTFDFDEYERDKALSSSSSIGTIKKTVQEQVDKAKPMVIGSRQPSKLHLTRSNSKEEHEIIQMDNGDEIKSPF